ncbi:MAG: EndoU domain-containing protein [Vulcanimicrobiota bacterium]
MAIGNFFSSVYDGASKAVNTVGRGISAVGQGISDGAHWAQEKVGEGVTAVDHAVDRGIDTFEHSPVGDNFVGKALGEMARTNVHFTGGLVKGVTGLGTGLVGLAGTAVKVEGGAMQYATDAKYRQDTNQAVSNFASNVAKDPLAIPRNLAHSAKEAWDKDPADFLGQAAGVIGATVLTAGAGTAAEAAGAAGRAGEIAATAGRAGELAEGAVAAGRAGEVATAARAGEGVEAAAKAGQTVEAATTATRTEEAAAAASRAFPKLRPADLPETPAFQGYDNVARHMVEDQASFVSKNAKGVVGGHYPEEFARTLGEKGQITSRSAIDNLEGVEHVKYKIFQQSPQGERLDVFKAGNPEKTLFDPSIWKPEDITNLARNAFGDQMAAGAEGTIEGSFNGMKFIGWARNGQLNSFGIVP